MKSFGLKSNAIHVVYHATSYEFREGKYSILLTLTLTCTRHPKNLQEKKLSEFCGKMPRDLGARWKRICFSGAAKQYVFFFMLTVFTNEQSIISRYIIICQCYRYSLQFYYSRKQMPSTLINAINAEWAKNPFNILHS